MKKIFSILGIIPSAFLLSSCDEYSFIQVDLDEQINLIKTNYCTGETIAANDYYIDIHLEGKKYNEMIDDAFQISDVCYDNVEISKNVDSLTVKNDENITLSLDETTEFETQTITYADMDNVAVTLEVDGSGEYSYSKFLELYELQLAIIKQRNAEHLSVKESISNFSFDLYVDDFKIRIHDAISDIDKKWNSYIPMYFIKSTDSVTSLDDIEYKSEIDLCNSDDLEYNHLLLRFRRESHFEDSFYNSIYHDYIMEFLGLDRLHDHDTFGLFTGQSSTVYIPIQINFPSVNCFVFD